MPGKKDQISHPNSLFSGPAPAMEPTSEETSTYLLTQPSLSIVPTPPSDGPPSRSGKQASQPGSLKRTDIQAERRSTSSHHIHHTQISFPLFLRTAHLESEHQDTKIRRHWWI